MAISTYVFIIILNENGLNVTIKRRKVNGFLKTIYMLPTRDSF